VVSCAAERSWEDLERELSLLSYHMFCLQVCPRQGKEQCIELILDHIQQYPSHRVRD
jgi:hypothetical protein